MAPDVAAAEERRRPEGTDPACPVEDPAPSETHEAPAGLRQATWAPRAGASPGLLPSIFTTTGGSVPRPCLPPTTMRW